MLSTKKHSPQLGLFHGLADQLDQKHPLYLLANKINWPFFDEAFKVHYSEKMGKPAKPIRLMVSLLILKYVRNLSDENLVDQWTENNYFQYLSGEQHFQARIPCVATELIVFRQRIGEAEVELILKESIRINEPPKDGNGAVISVDTMVQGKNITYPTDDKLYKIIINKCWIIADKEAINLQQSYIRIAKKLGHVQRFKRCKQGAKSARKANKKIQIITGRLVRELFRKLPQEGFHSIWDLNLYQRVLLRKRGDHDKIYSLHEPDVKCYSKGKEHKNMNLATKLLFF